MQNYNVRLESKISKSYRCTRAANSVDLDVSKKSVHQLSIQADIESDFNIGLIVGNSGSGKTTLAKKIYGNDCFKSYLDDEKPIIDQFPESMSYDDCVKSLMAIGLTSVPCWVRPANTLSNGQRVRAELALTMAKNENEVIVIDEWTSVVDRTVAKAMSVCVSKFARKANRKIVLCSCHYDIVEWLRPNWIIDCNAQTFQKRRLLQRNEKLQFDIREISRDSWRYFSKYHYLSDKLPGGLIFLFGLFYGDNQIGFQCFANYTPRRKDARVILHFNRTVIHPDYVGLGLGVEMINKTSQIMENRGYRIMAKFSSEPVHRALQKSKAWKYLGARRQLGQMQKCGNMMRRSGFRENVKTYQYEWIGESDGRN